MAIDYVGPIILEIDGQEYDVESVDTTDKTGRKVVKTMNRTGKPKGSARGIKEFSLKITVPIPPAGEPNWWDMSGAKLTMEPLDTGGKRITYTGCSVEEVGSKYQVEGEAKRDLSLHALDRREE